MFGSSGRTVHLKSYEEQEIIRLESKINQLSADLTAQKTKSAVYLSEEKNHRARFVYQGRTMERERIKKICKLPEFQGRQDMALEMALTGSPTASPESIGLLLANIPKKENTNNQFAEHMAALGNPDVGAGFDSEYEAENSNILQSIASGDI